MVDPIFILLSRNLTDKSGNLIGRVAEGSERGMIVFGDFSGRKAGEFVAVDNRSPRSVRGTAILGVLPWSFLSEDGFVVVKEAESMDWQLPLPEAKAKFAPLLERAIIAKQAADEAMEREMAETAKKKEQKRIAFLNSFPIEVETVGMEYEAGDYVAWDGVKGGGKRGYGWGSAPIPSKLFVVTCHEGETLKVRVDRVFKQEIGRLSPKRKKAIDACRPARLKLVRGDDPWYGEDQILASTEDMTQWLGRVMEAIAK